MKIRSLLGALVLFSLPAMPVWAENLTPEDIKKLVDEGVERRLQGHGGQEGPIERREGTAAPAAEPGIGNLQKSAENAALTSRNPCLLD